jgi:hypothetical protein
MAVDGGTSTVRLFLVKSTPERPASEYPVIQDLSPI